MHTVYLTFGYVSPQSSLSQLDATPTTMTTVSRRNCFLYLSFKISKSCVTDFYEIWLNSWFDFRIDQDWILYPGFIYLFCNYRWRWGKMNKVNKGDEKVFFKKRQVIHSLSEWLPFSHFVHHKNKCHQTPLCLRRGWYLSWEIKKIKAMVLYVQTWQLLQIAALFWN